MLSFRVAGRILERRVKTGDQVKEGDILATLDAAPYQAELDRVAASLRRAQAAYANAAGQLDRDKQLFAKGIVAKARFDNSSAAAKQAQAEVGSLEAAQERVKLDLGYTELRAPFPGTVSAVFAETFEEVKPSEPVMRLIDPAEIEMIVNVPESLISYVPHVIDLRATFDAFPGVEIPAEVTELGTEASESTRTYPVKLLLTPPQNVAILPGMAGRVRGKPGPEHRPAGEGRRRPALRRLLARRRQGQLRLGRERGRQDRAPPAGDAGRARGRGRQRDGRADAGQPGRRRGRPQPPGRAGRPASRAQGGAAP